MTTSTGWVGTGDPSADAELHAPRGDVGDDRRRRGSAERAAARRSRWRGRRPRGRARARRRPRPRARAREDGATARGAASRTSCSTIGWSSTFTVLFPGDRPPPETSQHRHAALDGRPAARNGTWTRTPGHEVPNDVQIGNGRPMGSAAAQHGCDRSYVKEDDAHQDEHPAAPPGPRRGRGARSHRARLGERGFRRAPGWNPQGRHRRRQPEPPRPATRTPSRRRPSPPGSTRPTTRPPPAATSRPARRAGP